MTMFNESNNADPAIQRSCEAIVKVIVASDLSVAETRRALAKLGSGAVVARLRRELSEVAR